MKLSQLAVEIFQSVDYCITSCMSSWVVILTIFCGNFIVQCM